MSKWVAGVLVALFIILSIVSVILGQQIKSLEDLINPFAAPTPTIAVLPPQTEKESRREEPDIAIVAQNLSVPWSMAFLPDGRMLVTEREGNVRLIDADGVLQPDPVAIISQVKQIGEGGLLGITIHPQFLRNKYVYVYYTYSTNTNNIRNRVARYIFDGESFSDEKIIVDSIPGASNHNGGRIAFGPDGYLYITTGDAQDDELAQNTSSVAGKILRVTDTGAAAPGNPFDNAVYSYGHRNPQGIAWDDQGQLWSTEHGRSGVLSGFDEVNLIESGNNYGWPEIQGDEKAPGMQAPLSHSGATTTWAPGGMAFYQPDDEAKQVRLFFAGLRGQGLYEATLDGKRVVSVEKHFDGMFGRIRDVVLGSDNFLYIATSNRDGRGLAKENDDKILRINPEKL